jgi:hypothetical protein
MTEGTCHAIFRVTMLAWLIFCTACTGEAPADRPAIAQSTPIVSATPASLPPSPVATAAAPASTPTPCVIHATTTTDIPWHYEDPPLDSYTPFMSDPDPATGTRYIGAISFAWSLQGPFAWTNSYAVRIANTGTAPIPVSASDFTVMDATGASTQGPLHTWDVRLIDGAAIGAGITAKAEVPAAAFTARATMLTWQMAGRLGTVTVPLFTPKILPTPGVPPRPCP